MTSYADGVAVGREEGVDMYDDLVRRYANYRGASARLMRDDREDAMRLTVKYRGAHAVELIDSEVFLAARANHGAVIRLLQNVVDRLIKGLGKPSDDGYEMRIRSYTTAVSPLTGYYGKFIVDDHKPEKKEPLPPEWGEEAP